MQKCARCGEEFAPVRFIQDLKKTLLDVGEDYTLREDVLAQQSPSQREPRQKSRPRERSGGRISAPHANGWRVGKPPLPRSILVAIASYR